MFYRKLYVAFYTSILAVIILYLIEPVPSIDGGMITGILVYGSSVVPIIYVYGILTSMIAEKLGKRLEREWIAFGVHLLFGLSFIIPYYFIIDPQTLFRLAITEIFTNPIIWLGVLFSIIFYFIDHLLIKREIEVVTK